jgi:malate dehydrogenase (oxaloacetate-decarboxylating)
MQHPQIPSYLDFDNLRERFPKRFSEKDIASAQTLFLKKMAVEMHRFYGGKVMTIPKAGVYGMGWFGVWYTPGVSAISTAIRDDHLSSFELSSRGNSVAVVSDSTRVLGDGDCSPAGGLGVMEGKAFLMYYLGGVSASALCIDSHAGASHGTKHAHEHSKKGGSKPGDHEHDPQKIIDFVRMVAPSFGAINLEDIAQPNCFKVLDDLQDCGIPVWHDDAQGTACVTLAGVINALKVTGRNWKNTKAVFYGAGASMTTIVRLLLAEGLTPENCICFDSKGGLHAGRKDVEKDKRFYRKWEICQQTNPQRIEKLDEALRGADMLIAASTPGPGIIKPEQVKLMGKNAIVFACANPVPEIYPYEAIQAGAAVVATGRSDFPNQVNNSLCFPGLMKGALLVRASRVSDMMAIVAAREIAKVAEEKGLRNDKLMPTMMDVEVFPRVAAKVAEQAVKEGLARKPMSADDVFTAAAYDIKEAQNVVKALMAANHIKAPPEDLVNNVLAETVKEIDAKVKVEEAVFG